MNTHKSLIAASLAMLFLAACSSGGMGDILGGGSSPRTEAYEIRGTVDSIDLNRRSLLLTNVSGYTSMLSGGGNTVRVHFDDQTDVEFQGQNYRVGDLERGDQVSVRVTESGSNLMAESVTVTHDITGGGTSHPSTSGSTVRGTVTHVDTSRRTIEVDRGHNSRVVVEYDTTTPVYFNNQTYRPADLERGDEIDIRVRDFGSGRMVAQDISVVRSVSSGGFGSSPSAMSTIRGTVRYHDPSRRTIELDSVSMISSFNTGSTLGNRVVVHYDANIGVDVSGRLQPITGLEAGDVIDVHVQDTARRELFAQRVILVRDVNSRY